ncbi:MAG: FAD-dependent monooxygenase [Paracoccaceae bacterium]|nr:FAD-dependent monooxygenase [Paracoccaceae bacterium]
MESKKTGSALVSGGSIGGLFAAAALMRAGWTVKIYERTDVELAGRGAGIVTHDRLIKALKAVGAEIADLGVDVEMRAVFDRSGAVVSQQHYPQIVTSWDRMHRILRALVPEGTYHLGRTIIRYENRDACIVATFDDGSTEEADVLIGADGFRSAIRGQMHPDIQPEYSGYVVWRALAEESAIPADVHSRVFADFGFFLPNGTQMIGYPIAGAENDLRPGHRRYNFVWYAAFSEDELRDMLTDAQGRYHPVSIPPPLVRDDVLDDMNKAARNLLPPEIFDILQHSKRPFFTPIYDLWSPTFNDGRVALAGDAACVARPHVGMGVTKAAEDALALARLLDATDVPGALEAYSKTRAPLSRDARDLGRRLGSYIFERSHPQNDDGRNHPDMDVIVRETAAILED